MASVPALVDRAGERVSKGRISPALRTALVLIVHEGLSVAESAQRTGYKYESLQKALLKPHVRHAKEAVKRAFLASETEQAWLTVIGLARKATSEDIKLKAAKVLLDAAGELTPKAGDDRGPRALVQIVMHHPSASEAQPITHRLPGVIEAQPIQRGRRDPSNSTTVGRQESDA